MRIIIAGAGEVGTHLAKLLSREHHDITLMDESKERLGNLSLNYDIMTQEGSPKSIHDLEEVGVKGVDLFVAVTPHESVNISSCFIAHHMGAKKTLARIDNYEYLLDKNKEFFQSIGIDHLIYPEVLAAREISDSLQYSWIRNRLEFCNGALLMLAIKVRENSSMVGKKFNTGEFNHGRYRVVAIKRNQQTIIPGGEDEIKSGDLIFCITTPSETEYLREVAGKKNYPLRDITFMGATRIAQKAIQNIERGGEKGKTTQVRLIDSKLTEESPILQKVSGDVLALAMDMRNEDAVRDEGIDQTDAFVAVSESSEANILACLVAKRNGVHKTIAEVENMEYISLAESLDIGAVINKKVLTASYIYQLMLNASVLNVRNLTAADAEILEIEATPGSRITLHPIREISLPNKVNIGGLSRRGVGMTVNGNTIIQPGDHVVVFCAASALRDVERLFK